MFSFLIPKEAKFFDLFDKHAETCVEGARAFTEMLAYYSEAPAMAKRVRDAEHRCDEITHHCVEMLHKTFITPIDRDQIHKLISAMDDVMDLMHGASQRMVLYEVEAPTDYLRDMGRALLQAVLEIQKAVHNLRDLKNAPAIFKSCIEINKLENDADALRDAAVAKLFKNEKDAVKVLIWKEIYESVETSLDRCEDVANIIEGVVLENA